MEKSALLLQLINLIKQQSYLLSYLIIIIFEVLLLRHKTIYIKNKFYFDKNILKDILYSAINIQVLYIYCTDNELGSEKLLLIFSLNQIVFYNTVLIISMI